MQRIVRVVSRVFAGLIAVAVLLFGLLVLALPRIVDTDAFQIALHDSAEAAFGSSIEWQEFEIGLLPLRVVIDRPVFLAAVGNPEDARLTAESVDLRLALFPILRRRIQIDSLILHGVELVLTRTPEGFLLPVAVLSRDADETIPDESATSEQAPDAGIGDTSVRKIVISKSRVVIRDRTLSPAVEWRFEDLELRASEAADGVEGRTLAIELTTNLRSGPTDVGHIKVTGSLDPTGLYGLEFEIQDLLLAEFQPYVSDATVAGKLSGRISLEGATSMPSEIVRLEVDVDIDVEARLWRMPDYVVEGPMHVSLELESPFSDRPSGQITVDLTAARLEVPPHFAKPPGMRVELTTRFESEESGEIVFESQIRFRNVDEILLQGAIGDSTSVSLTTPSFDLDGWSDVLPALDPYQLDGRIRLQGIGFERIEGSPHQLDGRIEFESVGLRVPGSGRLRIHGAILGDGTRIRTEALRVLVGGTTVGVDGWVEDLWNEARFQLALKSIGDSDANDLLSAMTSTRDTLYGNLEFTGEFSGIASSQTEFYDALEGRLEISVGAAHGGRLRGVSILQTLLDQNPLLGGAMRLGRSDRDRRSVDEYLGENFEIIEGDFEIGRGVVNAKTLRLAYEVYEVKLSGPIRLRDLSIDMSGEVLLEWDLVSALIGLSGMDQADRKPIRIPLARVTNTLAEPHIELTKDTLLALPNLLFRAIGIDTLGSGVAEAFGRLLGGGEK